MENVIKHLERLKAWDEELEEKLAQFEEAGKYE